jgi:hypothetical protein
MVEGYLIQAFLAGGEGRSLKYKREDRRSRKSSFFEVKQLFDVKLIPSLIMIGE